MSRSLIPNGETPAARADCLSVPVTPIGDRSGSRNHNYPRAGIERRFQSNLHIADHVNRRGNNFCEYSAHNLSQLRTSRRRPSSTSARNLLWRNAGSSTGLTYRHLQRLARLRLSYANNVAGAGSRGRKNTRFIAHRAGSLRPATVNAKKVGHDYF